MCGLPTAISDERNQIQWDFGGCDHADTYEVQIGILPMNTRNTKANWNQE
jgi:hypothetical protein